MQDIVSSTIAQKLSFGFTRRFSYISLFFLCLEKTSACDVDRQIELLKELDYQMHQKVNQDFFWGESKKPRNTRNRTARAIADKFSETFHQFVDKIPELSSVDSVSIEAFPHFTRIPLDSFSSRTRIFLIRELVDVAKEWDIEIPFCFHGKEFSIQLNSSSSQPGNGKVTMIGSYKDIYPFLTNEHAKLLADVRRRFQDQYHAKSLPTLVLTYKKNEGRKKLVDLDLLNILLDFEVARRLYVGDVMHDLPIASALIGMFQLIENFEYEYSFKRFFGLQPVDNGSKYLHPFKSKDKSKPGDGSRALAIKEIIQQDRFLNDPNVKSVRDSIANIDKKINEYTKTLVGFEQEKTSIQKKQNKIEMEKNKLKLTSKKAMERKEVEKKNEDKNKEDCDKKIQDTQKTLTDLRQELSKLENSFRDLFRQHISSTIIILNKKDRSILERHKQDIEKAKADLDFKLIRSMTAKHEQEIKKQATTDSEGNLYIASKLFKIINNLRIAMNSKSKDPTKKNNALTAAFKQVDECINLLAQKCCEMLEAAKQKYNKMLEADDEAVEKMQKAKASARTSILCAEHNVVIASRLKIITPETTLKEIIKICSDAEVNKNRATVDLENKRIFIPIAASRNALDSAKKSLKKMQDKYEDEKMRLIKASEQKEALRKRYYDFFGGESESESDDDVDEFESGKFDVSHPPSVKPSNADTINRFVNLTKQAQLPKEDTLAIEIKKIEDDWLASKIKIIQNQYVFPMRPSGSDSCVSRPRIVQQGDGKSAQELEATFYDILGQSQVLELKQNGVWDGNNCMFEAMAHYPEVIEEIVGYFGSNLSESDKEETKNVRNGNRSYTKGGKILRRIVCQWILDNMNEVLFEEISTEGRETGAMPKLTVLDIVESSIVDDQEPQDYIKKLRDGTQFIDEEISVIISVMINRPIIVLTEADSSILTSRLLDSFLLRRQWDKPCIYLHNDSKAMGGAAYSGAHYLGLRVVKHEEKHQQSTTQHPTVPSS